LLKTSFENILLGSRNDVEAYLYSTEFVKKRLKAPSTADFSSKRESTVLKLGEHEYAVTGYVDSENGFGAKIRSNWSTKVRKEGDGWVLEHVQIGD